MNKKYTPYDIFSVMAYPNNDMYMYIPAQYDTQKWLNTVKEIYYKEHEGIERNKAIKESTSGWKVTEMYDFLNWMRFYEAGDHLKYKYAQSLWYENGTPGYFLHIKKDPVQEKQNHVSGEDIDFAKDSVKNDSSKKEIIEKQRSKIIGRLDSAEKLLRSPDGQIFSGKEFETLLESIYQLKKKIQMVNKISSSVKLYEDMIVREANILNKKGFVKASDVLHSIAQAAIPVPASSGDPSGAGNPGAPGTLPSMGPGMPQGGPSSSLPGSAPNNSPNILNNKIPKGIEDFLEGMNTSKLTTNDSLEVSDAEDDMLDIFDSDDLLKSAQMQPPQAINEPLTSTPSPEPLNPSKKITAPPSKEESLEVSEDAPLEVTENDVKPNISKDNISISQFDKKMDDVFSHITVQDIIEKLEDLAKIFKTREIPRQLAVVDMMLDAKGLASFFPTLSEATNKALESNNYISTRVEDILSKLRGQVGTKDIDLQGENVSESPDVAGIKNKLQEDAEKEKLRKQKRKEQEQAELDMGDKATPEVELKEDLAPQQTTPPIK